MLHLALRLAGHRISALLAVAAAVLGGAALVTATGVLAESGLRSHLPAGRLTGADLVISADQTLRPPGDLPIALPERRPIPAGPAGQLTRRLAQQRGVLDVTADLSFPAALVDGHGQVVSAGDPRSDGHGWTSARLLDPAKTLGTAPSGPGQVALPQAVAAAAGVRLGEPVRVTAAGRTGSYRVTALVTGVDAGILFDDRTAATLAGRDSGPRAGTVDLIAVRTRLGAAAEVLTAVRHDLRGTGLLVATGPARGDTAAPEATTARYLLVLLASSLAGIILLIVGFVIAGALSVSIAGQRRPLALLRAVGATPRQLRRLVAGQATLIALVALAPGVGLGYLLAGQFRRLLVGVATLPPGLPLTFSPLPALASVLLLVAVVQVSARGAAWRPSRRSAIEAVAETQSRQRPPSVLRVWAGISLLVTAAGLAVGPLLARSVVGAAGTSLAGIVAGIGAALAGPVLVRRAGDALAGRLPAGVSPPTWLAVANVRGQALRVAGAVTTLAMAVIFTLTYTLAQTTVATAAADDVRSGTRAQLSVSAPGLGGVPDGVLERLRASVGVQAAVPLNRTTVLWSYRELGDETVESTPATVLGPDAAEGLDPGLRSGSLGRLSGATVAVGSDVARSRHAGTGRSIRLILGDGTRVQARVVAVYGRSLGFGPIVLSRDLVAGHTSTGLDESVLVRTDGSAAVRKGLANLVASSPGLVLSDTSAAAGSGRGIPPEGWINLATLAVLLGYLLLGIANTLVAATAARRPELALLRLIGATPRQVRALMRREAALIGAAALALAAVVSAIPLALLGIGLLQRPWPSGPIWLAPASALVVLAIAGLAIELPTRQALRTPAMPS